MSTKICPAIFIIILFLSFQYQVKAQRSAGIGTVSPDSSAVLELKSTKKGFLPPRVSLQSGSDATTIVLPATGLLTYNTNSALVGANGSGIGFYYNKGTSAAPVWVRINTAEGQVNVPRTIWGVVRANGTIVTGSGDFTVVKISAGKYEITFNTAFVNYPACISNQYLVEPPFNNSWPDPKDNSGVAGVTKTKAYVWTCDSNYSFVDRTFAFSCTGF